MILDQTGKHVTLNTGVVATDATSRHYVDSNGFGAVDILVSAPKATATNGTGTFTSLALQHSDTTDATNFSTIVEGTSGTPTSSQFSMPTNNDTDAWTDVRLSLAKQGSRKRYVGVLIRATAAAYDDVSISAMLSRAAEGPVTNGGALVHAIR
jgi:hypothetical protein